jgi:hypothetical protein
MLGKVKPSGGLGCLNIFQGMFWGEFGFVTYCKRTRENSWGETMEELNSEESGQRALAAVTRSIKPNLDMGLQK